MTSTTEKSAATRGGMTWQTWGVLAVIAGAIGISVLPPFAGALHTKVPPVLQVSTAPGQTVGSVHFSIGHSILVFHSDGDLLSNGNTVPQVFIFDMTQRVSGKKLPGLYQLTFGDQASLSPSAAARGRVLAFHSADDLLNNGSVGRQIFASRTVRWRKGDVPLTQLTQGPSESFDPVLTQTGRYIFFSSTGDLAKEQLPPGTRLYRSELRKFQKGQCTTGYPCKISSPGLVLVSRENASHPAPNQNGTRVVFESAGDAAGNGCVNGVTQLFMRDFPAGTTEQLTFGTSPSQNAVFTIDSTQIYFDSAADLTGNGNSVRNIFMIDLEADRRLSGGAWPITQVTFGTDGDTYEPAPSGPSGRRIFMKSTASYTNAAPGVERLFIFEPGLQKYVRLTDGEPITSNLTSQFTFAGFASTADFTGQNPSGGNQVFVINAYPLLDAPPRPATPTVSPTPHATVTPVAGQPNNIGFGLVVNEAADNGNDTLTTVFAATVADFFGNPVADGTPVQFSVIPDAAGVVIGNGFTNSNPDCDLSRYEEKIGITVLNRPGVAHVCVTYPGGLAGTTHSFQAASGPLACDDGINLNQPCTDDSQCPPIGRCSISTDIPCTGESDCPVVELCVQHDGHCRPTVREVAEFKLPLPHNDCLVNGQSCSDFNPCTDGEICAGGLPDRICVGGSNDGAACTADIQCPNSKRCYGGSNHNGACVTSFDCPPEGGGLPGECLLATTGACQLTTPPICQPGTPRTCADDGNLCTTDVCNFYSGTCGVPIHCAYDANPCTDDVCDPATGLCYIPNSEPCDSMNPCLDDVCDGTTGTCGVPNTDPCEDGDLCTTGDICAAGACIPGAPLVCPNDSNPCTNDVCNPEFGTCGLPQACACP